MVAKPLFDMYLVITQFTPPPTLQIPEIAPISQHMSHFPLPSMSDRVEKTCCLCRKEKKRNSPGFLNSANHRVNNGSILGQNFPSLGVMYVYYA